MFIRSETHFEYVSNASGTLRVALSLDAKSDHSATSDCTRASQARLASSYDARSSFCRPSAASVRSCPQLRNDCVSALPAVVVSLAIMRYRLCYSLYSRQRRYLVHCKEAHQFPATCRRTAKEISGD